jgi:hypothetical protein
MLAKEQRNTSLAKELETRSKDAKVTVHGKELTIGEVLNGVVSSSPGRDIPINTPLKFMQKITSDDINRHYVDNMMVKDMVNIANSFNNEFSEPAIFITDVKIEDTSDEFNYLNRLKFNFAIPGKAPQEIKQKYPEIPWSQIRGMRNRIAHEYFEIDENIVWATCKIDFPKLRPLLVKALDSSHE